MDVERRGAFGDVEQRGLGAAEHHRAQPLQRADRQPALRVERGVKQIADARGIADEAGGHDRALHRHRDAVG